MFPRLNQVDEEYINFYVETAGNARTYIAPNAWSEFMAQRVPNTIVHVEVEGEGDMVIPQPQSRVTVYTRPLPKIPTFVYAETNLPPPLSPPPPSDLVTILSYEDMPPPYVTEEGL